MSENEYLMLIGKGDLRPLLKQFKEMGGFFTGSNWAFPSNCKPILTSIVENLPNHWIHQSPFAEGNNFEAYRQTYKAKFLKKLLSELDSEIVQMTDTLNLSDFTFDSIQELNIDEDGKDALFEKLQRRDNLKESIAHAEGMEKALKEQKSSQVSFETQLEQERTETAAGFLGQHKETFSSGVLLAGYGQIDKRLFYVPGDLIIVQGMSNHGKTKWMEQKAYNFLTNSRNVEKDPVCVFISFENSPLFVKQDFFNLISKHQDGGKRFIAFDPSYSESGETESPFLYPDLVNGFQRTVSTYEKWKKNQNLIFLENVQFENLPQLVSKMKERLQDRPIVIFLDYVQIIPNAVDSDGWERIKELSYGLERLAQQNKVIVVAGSQVNEKRETREGKDVYNAATIVEDVFNHSHSSLELNESLKSKHVPQENGKNIVSITITKYKRGSSFCLDKAFLFDGHSFEEKKINSSFPNPPTSVPTKPRPGYELHKHKQVHT